MFSKSTRVLYAVSTAALAVALGAGSAYADVAIAGPVPKIQNDDCGAKYAGTFDGHDPKADADYLRLVECYGAMPDLDKFLSIRSHKPYTDIIAPGLLNWEANACTSSPDYPFGFKFADACIKHDFGYTNFPNIAAYSKSGNPNLHTGTGARTAVFAELVKSIESKEGAQNSYWRQKVDEQFRVDLKKRCEGESGNRKSFCMNLANMYADGVKKFGAGAWSSTLGTRTSRSLQDSTQGIMKQAEQDCGMPTEIPANGSVNCKKSGVSFTGTTTE